MTDPHVHVEVNLVRAGADVRNLLARTFGLVADLPAEVATGCGQRVPRAMTSPRPASVTCLPCREYASEQHRRFADELETLFRMPGATVDGEDSARAVARHRDLAARFAGE
ncbi:hypothetical protein BJY16_000096 [Actinoplanes octamycinicus]|uniref:Uncharacterized protein n=1 Tax=Actinoplanes octamycinicus TaxID=135948 RepID=A0A7W7M4F1_9ACTN|nr:hypothetical protein [Actinoplanes octamycinicus]MBB4736637.1 hypothetical protein [Actinoplanes octamycinicus]GIE63157.1 hypothetical protein Aoc01nite_85590 [Actinoplanes octamycinicus]